MRDLLLAKIHTHTATITVIGHDYVGLLLARNGGARYRLGSGQTLAVAFAEKGFPITFVAT